MVMIDLKKHQNMARENEIISDNRQTHNWKYQNTLRSYLLECKKKVARICSSVFLLKISLKFLLVLAFKKKSLKIILKAMRF